MSKIMGTAIIQGAYRYTLTREGWDSPWPESAQQDLCLWVMLNPSTADGSKDDPTIRRLIAYTREWGFKRLRVENLFALRSTDPQALLTHPAPIGPMNDPVMAEALREADRVVFAWGNGPKGHWPLFKARADLVDQRARKAGKMPMHFGLTKSKQPKHPLYQAKDAAVKPLKVMAFR